MSTTQIWNLVLALPFFVMLLWTPPKTRMGYLAYSTIFGVLASVMIFGVFTFDLASRALAKSADQNADIAIANSSQAAAAIIGMLLGGLSTNLLVAGLSLPWVERTFEVKMRARDAENAKKFLDLALDGLERRLKLLPNSSWYDEVQSARQDPTILQLMRDLNSPELEAEFRQRFDRLAKGSFKNP